MDMDRINVYAPSEAHAERLLGAMEGRSTANLNGDKVHEVAADVVATLVEKRETDVPHA
jgi:hypothetical protein